MRRTYLRLFFVFVALWRHGNALSTSTSITPTASATVSPSLPALCGNGIVDSGEQCDTGAVSSGCLSCLVSAGWTCTPQNASPSKCVVDSPTLTVTACLSGRTFDGLAFASATAAAVGAQTDQINVLSNTYLGQSRAAATDTLRSQTSPCFASQLERFSVLLSMHGSAASGLNGTEFYSKLVSLVAAGDGSVTSSALCVSSLTLGANQTSVSVSNPVEAAWRAEAASALATPGPNEAALLWRWLGPVIGVLGLLAIALIVCCLYRRRKRGRAETWSSGTDEEADAAFSDEGVAGLSSLVRTKDNNKDSMEHTTPFTVGNMDKTESIGSGDVTVIGGEKKRKRRRAWFNFGHSLDATNAADNTRTETYTNGDTRTNTRTDTRADTRYHGGDFSETELSATGCTETDDVTRTDTRDDSRRRRRDRDELPTISEDTDRDRKARASGSGSSCSVSSCPEKSESGINVISDTGQFDGKSFTHSMTDDEAEQQKARSKSKRGRRQGANIVKVPDFFGRDNERRGTRAPGSKQRTTTTVLTAPPHILAHPSLDDVDWDPEDTATAAETSDGYTRTGERTGDSAHDAGSKGRKGPGQTGKAEGKSGKWKFWGNRK